MAGGHLIVNVELQTEQRLRPDVQCPARRRDGEQKGQDGRPKGCSADEKGLDDGGDGLNEVDDHVEETIRSGSLTGDLPPRSKEARVTNRHRRAAPPSAPPPAPMRTGNPAPPRLT